ncbi:hypothetical protein [Pseudonocardia sp. MH-G8]|uniref:hypothetical protein n=1 Tax=Pseudonocardia sp. MH-G8 TaxID=1854588 RepID=UPI0011799B6B|nr:hypothetical protein [Pseudonocardia sp. MH-G8]
MTTSSRIALLSSVLTAALLTGCSATAPQAGTRPTTPSQDALLAYERYWTVSQEAFSAPRARDWTADLQGVASGSALDSLIADVRNYADFPAHTEGAVNRSPAVGTATDDRVEILDCVQLGDSRLIADATGEVLDDLANRAPRYRFRAEVVRSGDRWLVRRTEPKLEEPC